MNWEDIVKMFDGATDDLEIFSNVVSKAESMFGYDLELLTQESCVPYAEEVWFFAKGKLSLLTKYGEFVDPIGAHEFFRRILTRQEKMSIFHEIDHEYLCQDAARHLGAHFGIDINDVDACPENVLAFEDTMGYSFSEAVDTGVGSNYYALDYLVERFEEEQDCNVAENVTWANIVSEFVETNRQKN